MTDDELTTLDVFSDPDKNLVNLIASGNDDDTEEENNPLTLQDNLYYTETEFNSLLLTNGYCSEDNLTILCLNIANLLSKLSSLNQFLSNLKGNKPDVIVVVETHIPCKQFAGYDRESLKKLIKGYTFFHEGRRAKRGGGVGIFVNDEFKSEPQLCEPGEKGVDFLEEVFENVVVRIPGCIKVNQNQAKDLIIMAIYRQPDNGNTEVFLEHLDTLMSRVNKTSNELVLAGDFNLDLIRYSSHEPTAKYLDIMTNYGMIPRIVRPTRIKKQSAAIACVPVTMENCNFHRNSPNSSSRNLYPTLIS